VTKRLTCCERRLERGQASVELVMVLPLVVVMIVGLLVLGRLLYVHLAILTAANDCATSAAQATHFDQMMSQGFGARQNSLATFQVSQSVTTGGIYSAIFAGQRFFSVEYTIHLPWQPYKSDWHLAE
jgi:hypothetical protein